MHIAVKMSSAALFAVLAGCSSLNPFAKKPAPRNPPAALIDFKPTMAVKAAWTASIGNAGSYVFSPAVTTEAIYVAAADGSVMRIEKETGRSSWRINAGMPLTAGVGSDGNTIAVAGDKGVVMAFDAQGKLRWKAQASSEVLSAPAVGQGIVIVRSVDNRIAAYDAESGTRRWVVQRTTPPLTLRSAPGILISGSSAYVALPGGRLLALAISNGGARWEVAVGDPRGTTELERISDLSGVPVVAGQNVCAAAYQGRVACFDVATGAPRWAKELSTDVGIGVDDRLLYASDERGAVTAFSFDTGSGVWRNTQLANRRLSNPVSLGRAIAVGDGQGYVHFLSREDGALAARVGTDGSPITGAVLLVPSRSAVFQTQQGTVVALATE